MATITLARANPTSQSDWLGGIIHKIHEDEKTLDPVIHEFKSLIEQNARLRALASAMFDEVPHDYDPTGTPQVRDLSTMLKLMNHLLREAPSWSERARSAGHVGLPFNTILNWPMATPSGIAFFLDQEVNDHLKRILNKWKAFLDSPESTRVLVDTDWLSPEALQRLAEDANADDEHSYTFEQLYDCDPNKPHYGWTSWENFFVRKFRPSVRPVQYRDPLPGSSSWAVCTTGTSGVVVNACESKPFALRSRVKESDSFWLKGQPYSLREIFAPSSVEHLANYFVGGTIYQAFLSPTTYHRWHAPVSGKIVAHAIIDGTYFSTLPAISSGGSDPSAPDRAQGYIAHVATRAIVVIEADNPSLGLVAFVAVGMAEISSCQIDAAIASGAKARVNKGDEIGMFHYGGSSHCLIFQPKTGLNWVEEAIPQDDDNRKNLAVNSALAFVRPGPAKCHACAD